MELSNRDEQFKEFIKTVILAVILALLVRAFVMEIYLVEGNSMVPTLQHHEYLLVNKFIYRFRPPKVGEIIVFKFAGDPGTDFIKRVIAVEGQTVEVSDGQVYVDGKALHEPYIGEPTLGHYGQVSVPEGSCFVLGDNRNHSSDSRFAEVGFINYDTIEGKAFLVFLPLRSIKTI